MSTTNTLEARITALERRNRILTGLLVVLAAFALTAAMRPAPDVLRSEGLVIVDAEGRQRVVLGAPLGGVSTHEGSSGTVGMIVYDTLGRPLTSIGYNNPNMGADGEAKPRIGTAAGMTFYDPRNGRERGGIGAFGDGRANVCLDYGESIEKEAACMSVAPGDQYAAVLLNAHPSSEFFDRVVMYTGADGASSIKVIGSGANRNGVFLAAGKGPLRAIVYDSAGESVDREIR